VKYLIVNADDFGYDAEISRGIVEAHRDGIVTAATLMVNTPAAEQAARLARENPALSVGLHVNFTNEAEDMFDLEDPALVRAELQRQFERFLELMGRKPDHLDSHQHVHRSPVRRPLFQELARVHALPLRDETPVVFKGGFYGQWEYGVSDPSKIEVAALESILRQEVHHGGLYELSCHPGHVDPTRRYVYQHEREIELRTLCHPEAKRLVAELGISLISYAQLPEACARLDAAVGRRDAEERRAPEQLPRQA
jgi:chitin disaccharide deacetylase